jgi:hypothetical protein
MSPWGQSAALLQPATQTPLTHVVPVAQTLPQAPQLCESPLMFVSQPFAGSRSQSAYPARQAWTWHWPATQMAVPFGSTHTFPHVPQLFASVDRFTQAAPHAVVPAGHVVHVPSTQTEPAAQQVVAPLAEVQTWPVAQQTPPAQVSPAAQHAPLQRTPEVHSVHPPGPQIMPAGQHVPLQITPLAHEHWPVAGSHVSPAGQQTPAQVGPAQEQAPLVVHVEPAGQHVPLAHCTLPVGHGAAHAPFTQLVPTAQHCPPHIGKPLDSQTQTPELQVVPAGQHVLPHALAQLVVPEGQAHTPRRPPVVSQKPVQQSEPFLQPLPMSVQSAFAIAALDWLRPIAPSMPTTPPPNSVRSALRREVPVAMRLARSSKLPSFTAHLGKGPGDRIDELYLPSGMISNTPGGYNLPPQFAVRGCRTPTLRASRQ